MKKAIVSALVGVLAVSAIALTAVSGDSIKTSEKAKKAPTSIDFKKTTVDEVVKVGDGTDEEKVADAFAKEEAPAKIEVSVPGQKDEVKAEYDSSINAFDGSVVDVYTDENNGFYMLDCTGKVMSAKVDSVDKKVKALESVDEIGAYAYEFMLTLTDTPERFTEVTARQNGWGYTGDPGDDNYLFIYNAMIGNYKTENDIWVKTDGYGNVKYYFIFDRVDYSGVDLDALAAITNEQIEAYAFERASALHPNGYDLNIEDVNLYKDNGQFYLSIKVEYTYDVDLGRSEPIAMTDSETINLYF